jgi:DNA-binding LacI/PurR family transcriptional regulator
MGYLKDEMASSLKRGRSNTIAVVVGDLTNPQVGPVLRGIVAGLEPKGMMPLVCETRDDSQHLKTILDRLRGRRIDGVLVIAARRQDGPTLRRFRRQEVPLMLALQGVQGLRLPLCAYDDALGGRLAAQHLLALGHKRVAQLRGPMDIMSCRDRAQGFSKAVNGAGVKEIVVEGEAPEGSVEDGRRLMRKLLDGRGPLPTGIFAHHDLMAIGAIGVARDYGLRIPDDLSIVGFHDFPYVEELVPALTSIRLSREELGRLTAEMVLEVLESPRGPTDRPVIKRVTPTLVTRESTGPPPKNTLRLDRRSAASEKIVR